MRRRFRHLTRQHICIDRRLQNRSDPAISRAPQPRATYPVLGLPSPRNSNIIYPECVE
ncbi:hypothetical protein BC834DRAFT_888706 [Gloeopeniophorella convolvens]|nr:hypothetical protein BC834DRAFT_888706 [Gloeopeniophorella convolvens]